MTPTVAVLRGDGIGPEVIESALSVLGACLPEKYAAWKQARQEPR